MRELPLPVEGNTDPEAHSSTADRCPICETIVRPYGSEPCATKPDRWHISFKCLQCNFRWFVQIAAPSETP
jgi:hypothetical protein